MSKPADLLRYLKVCNGFRRCAFLPFNIGNRTVGWLKPLNADLLRQWPSYFSVSDTEVAFNTTPATYAIRTAALQDVACQLHRDGVVTGWRDELISVHDGDPATPLAAIERAAGYFFGIWGIGLTVNGWVPGNDGRPEKIWTARRSPDKPTWPDHLDNFCGGGLPVGMTVQDNLVKELWEETGIPGGLAKTAVASGLVFHCSDLGEAGLGFEANYSFDLKLPPDFIPKNQDGEVAEFQIHSPVSLMGCISSLDDIVPSSRQEFTEFLIRHGFILPDMPEYFTILRHCRAVTWPFCNMT